MFGDISKAEKIYIACGYTDMRKSIDGLADTKFIAEVPAYTAGRIRKED